MCALTQAEGPDTAEAFAAQEYHALCIDFTGWATLKGCPGPFNLPTKLMGTARIKLLGLVHNDLHMQPC